MYTFFIIMDPKLMFATVPLCTVRLCTLNFIACQRKVTVFRQKIGYQDSKLLWIGTDCLSALMCILIRIKYVLSVSRCRILFDADATSHEVARVYVARTLLLYWTLLSLRRTSSDRISPLQTVLIWTRPPANVERGECALFVVPMLLTIN